MSERRTREPKSKGVWVSELNKREQRKRKETELRGYTRQQAADGYGSESVTKYVFISSEIGGIREEHRIGDSKDSIITTHDALIDYPAC